MCIIVTRQDACTPHFQRDFSRNFCNISVRVSFKFPLNNRVLFCYQAGFLISLCLQFINLCVCVCPCKIVLSKSECHLKRRHHSFPFSLFYALPLAPVLRRQESNSSLFIIYLKKVSYIHRIHSVIIVESFARPQSPTLHISTQSIHID